MKLRRSVLALLTALLPFASVSQAETMHLDTTVTYRERIALPTDAIMEVELLDTSRADAPSVRISSQRFKLTGVPRTVEIAYDTDLIEERLTYTVPAKISDIMQAMSVEHLPYREAVIQGLRLAGLPE